MPNKKALALPDALLVRYYKAGELEHVTKVTPRADQRIEVKLRIGGDSRADIWRDLGGGLGFVPDGE